MQPTRVLIADDDELFLEALSLLLTAETGFEIVGVARDGEEAVRLSLELRPDAVLLDVQMGAVNGLDAATRIREALPGTLIMVHSGESTLRAFEEGRRLGFTIRNKYELAGTVSALSPKRGAFS